MHSSTTYVLERRRSLPKYTCGAFAPHRRAAERLPSCRASDSPPRKGLPCPEGASLARSAFPSRRSDSPRVPKGDELFPPFAGTMVRFEGTRQSAWVDSTSSASRVEWLFPAISGSSSAEILMSGMAGLRGLTDVGGNCNRQKEIPKPDVRK